MQELRRSLAAQRGRWLRACLGIAAGGLVLAVGHAAIAPHGAKRFALSYLVALAFVLSLSLGALFFVVIQHLTRAGWSVLVRRLAEAMAANVIVAALLFVPIGLTVAAGSTLIYPWAVWTVPNGDTDAAHHETLTTKLEERRTKNEERKGQGGEMRNRSSFFVLRSSNSAPGVEHHAHHHQQLDALTLKKRAWLNPGFYLLRWVIFLVIWSALGWWYWRLSRLQDDDGDARHTVRCETLAGPATLIFAITFALGAMDLLMSLNPHWYSAVYGVYVFAGAVIGALAALILLVLGLQRFGVLTDAIGIEHLHDLGKLLFAFVFFWAYLAYSQYMLLWYAHLPETVTWLVHRGASTAIPNGWSALLLVLLFGHFLLPFLGLMSRHVKRRRRWLAAWAAWLLLAHWLDLLWLVMPEMGPHFMLGGVEIGLLAAVGGLYAAGLVWRLADGPLVPVGDPRLRDSLAFENI